MIAAGYRVATSEGLEALSAAVDRPPAIVVVDGLGSPSAAPVLERLHGRGTGIWLGGPAIYHFFLYERPGWVGGGRYDNVDGGRTEARTTPAAVDLVPGLRGGLSLGPCGQGGAAIAGGKQTSVVDCLPGSDAVLAVYDPGSPAGRFIFAALDVPAGDTERLEAGLLRWLGRIDR